MAINKDGKWWFWDPRRMTSMNTCVCTQRMVITSMNFDYHAAPAVPIAFA